MINIMKRLANSIYCFRTGIPRRARSARGVVTMSVSPAHGIAPQISPNTSQSTAREHLRQELVDGLARIRVIEEDHAQQLNPEQQRAGPRVGG